MRSNLFLLGALALVSCGSDSSNTPDGTGGTGSKASCQSSNTMTWAGTEYHEAQSAIDPSRCDPQIEAVAFSDFIGSGAPGINLALHYDLNATTKKFSVVTMNLNAATIGNYPYGTGTMESSATWRQPSADCSAGSGSVMLTEYTGVGGIAVGTFSFADFTALGSGSCPATVTGSFSMSVVDGD